MQQNLPNNSVSAHERRRNGLKTLLKSILKGSLFSISVYVLWTAAVFLSRTEGDIAKYTIRLFLASGIAIVYHMIFQSDRNKWALMTSAVFSGILLCVIELAMIGKTTFLMMHFYKNMYRENVACIEAVSLIAYGVHILPVMFKKDRVASEGIHEEKPSSVFGTLLYALYFVLPVVLMGIAGTLITVAANSIIPVIISVGIISCVGVMLFDFQSKRSGRRSGFLLASAIQAAVVLIAAYIVIVPLSSAFKWSLTFYGAGVLALIGLLAVFFAIFLYALLSVALHALKRTQFPALT